MGLFLRVFPCLYLSVSLFCLSSMCSPSIQYLDQTISVRGRLCVSSCVDLCTFFSHVHLYLRFMDSSFLRTSHARLHCRVRLRIVCSCTRVLVILCTCHLAVPNFDRLCTYAQVRFCSVNNRKPFSQTTILGITKNI